MIVLDPSGLLAALDVRARHHLGSVRPGYRTMWPVLDDVVEGAYDLVSFEPTDVAAARRILEWYADQEIGLADASPVVIAARYRTTSLLTLDE